MKQIYKQHCKGFTHRALSLVQKNIQNRINNLENNFDQPFINTNMIDVREKVQTLISLTGRAAVAVLPVGGLTNQIVVGDVSNYNKIGNTLTYVRFNTTNLNYTNSHNKSIEIEMKLENNKVRYSKIMTDKETEIVETLDDIFLNTPTIPCEIFLNDAYGLADIDRFKVRDQIERLMKFDEEQMIEFERSRSRSSINTTFAGDIDPVAVGHAIDTGQQITENGFAGKYGQGVTLIPATAGYVVLLQHIEAIERDIYQKLGMSVDSMSTGTNKHTAENLLKDQYQLSNLQRDLARRQYHWDNLFAIIESVAPTLKLSYVEETKIKMLKNMAEPQQQKPMGGVANGK